MPKDPQPNWPQSVRLVSYEIFDTGIQAICKQAGIRSCRPFLCGAWMKFFRHMFQIETCPMRMTRQRLKYNECWKNETISLPLWHHRERVSRQRLLLEPLANIISSEIRSSDGYFFRIFANKDITIITDPDPYTDPDEDMLNSRHIFDSFEDFGFWFQNADRKNWPKLVLLTFSFKIKSARAGAMHAPIHFH